MEWKASEKTKSCYKKLFTPISSDPTDDPADTYMARFLGKIWPTTIPSNIKEDIMKNRLIKNLHKLQKREKFLLSALDEETSEEEVEETKRSKRDHASSTSSAQTTTAPPYGHGAAKRGYQNVCLDETNILIAKSFKMDQ
ncbi:hypothetical protein C2G38_2253881 [Gigaspora rosea]|uniref:Uncharacterized protein n=1 Tax=Gigaspora rosea TaxID=44941 RepID=A0A397UDW0_9GLOM|nr:hypothetical protein C2G38_2253881 [Gigaspora rosea]